MKIGPSKWDIVAIILLLGVMAYLLLPSHVHRFPPKAKVERTEAIIEHIGTALSLYHIEVGDFPSTEHGLNAIIENPANLDGWNGPYLKKRKIPHDSWNNKLIYQRLDNGYSLLSLGADGKLGGTGYDEDIRVVLQLRSHEND